MLFRIILLLPITLFARPGYHEPWGKDANLQVETTHEQSKKKQNLPLRFAEKAILFHQNVISPVDGPRSHFRPTSSRYTLLCMQRYGFINGYLMGCDRLLRENKDAWYYRLKEIDGKLYKWDSSDKNPPFTHFAN